MANSWITHVRDYAKSRGITYASALSDPDIRTGYVKKAPAPRAPKSSSSDGGASAKLALKKLKADEKQMMKEAKKAEGVAKRLALVEARLAKKAEKKASKMLKA